VAVDRQWYRHQVQTSHTVGPQSALLALASGGLNLQIEHHLFPTVNHCHLRALQVRERQGEGEREVGCTGGHHGPPPRRSSRPTPYPTCTSPRPPALHPQPAIEAAARKHGVPYLKSATVPQAFGRLWAHLADLGRRPAKGEDAESE
jgi:hypothetical protein